MKARSRLGSDADTQQSVKCNAWDLVIPEEAGQMVASERGDCESRASIITGAAGISAQAAFCATLPLWGYKCRLAQPPAAPPCVAPEPYATGRACDCGRGRRCIWWGLQPVAGRGFFTSHCASGFSMTFLRVSLVPDCEALITLPRILGVQRVKELMLSAPDTRATKARSLASP